MHQASRFLVYPISFSIPAELLQDNVSWSSKSRTLATTVPGQSNTYKHLSQADYYKAYSTSLFGITFKKAGWDCLRHYEILAAGCVPYMHDAAGIPPGTMFMWPKTLLQEILTMRGVLHKKIRSIAVGKLPAASAQELTNAMFSQQAYMDILALLQDHMRKHLTTRAMASYMMSFSPKQPLEILFLGSWSGNGPDYLAETIFHGLHSLFGKNVVDIPARSWMFEGSDLAPSDVYGRGFSYAFMLKKYAVDREHILGKIAAHQYSHIVFAISHQGRHPWIDHVKVNYHHQEVFFLDGSDSGEAETNALFAEVCGTIGMCFRREMVCASVDV